MLYGPIVKVSRGLFPSHAGWTSCQNVPGTVAPDGHKVESHMSLQQMLRKIELLESHHVRISHFLSVPGSHSPSDWNCCKRIAQLHSRTHLTVIPGVAVGSNEATERGRAGSAFPSLKCLKILSKVVLTFVKYSFHRAENLKFFTATADEAVLQNLKLGIARHTSKGGNYNHKPPFIDYTKWKKEKKISVFLPSVENSYSFPGLLPTGSRVCSEWGGFRSYFISSPPFGYLPTTQTTESAQVFKVRLYFSHKRSLSSGPESEGCCVTGVADAIKKERAL